MYCKKCGGQLPEDAKFCNICGTSVNVEYAPVQPLMESKKFLNDKIYFWIGLFGLLFIPLLVFLFGTVLLSNFILMGGFLLPVLFSVSIGFILIFLFVVFLFHKITKAWKVAEPSWRKALFLVGIIPIFGFISSLFKSVTIIYFFLSILLFIFWVIITKKVYLIKARKAILAYFFVLLSFVISLAILGFIASIVLASLNTAREKALQQSPIIVLPSSSNPTSSNSPQVLGDYEIKIISPTANTTSYLGDNLIFEIAAGKKISSIDIHFPPWLKIDDKNIIRQNIDKNFVFTLNLPERSMTLGFSFFKIKANYLSDNNEDINNPSDISIPVYIDTYRNPISINMFMMDKIILSLSNRSTKDGITILVVVKFSNEKNDSSMIFPLPSAFFIEDPTIAELIPEISVSTNDITSTKIKPLKEGSTKLTIQYKNITKVVDVIVTK